MSQLTEDRCRFCGATVPPGEPVCPECGRVPLSPMGRCQKCGAHLYPGDAFCPKCGTRSKPQKESGNPNIDAFNQKQRKKKTAKRLCLGISIGICVLAVAVALTIFWILPYITYQRAMDALASGDYAQAYTLFLSLDGYQDSEAMINETRYQEAQALLQDQQFDKAIEIFTALGDYRDSIAYTWEATYLKAVHLKETEDYQNAYLTFVQLGDYEDSKKQSTECLLLRTTQLLELANLHSATEFTKVAVLRETQYYSYYNLIGKFIRHHNEVDYWYKNSDGDPTGTVLVLLSLLPEDYEDTDTLIQLFSAILNLERSKDIGYLYPKYQDVFEICWDLHFVNELVTSDAFICFHLEDYWYNQTHYFELRDGQLRTDLPFRGKPAGARGLAIKNQVLVWEDQNGNTLVEIFRFSKVNPNSFYVYCCQNGETYRFYRKGFTPVSMLKPWK